MRHQKSNILRVYKSQPSGRCQSVEEDVFLPALICQHICKSLHLIQSTLSATTKCKGPRSIITTLLCGALVKYRLFVFFLQLMKKGYERSTSNVNRPTTGAVLLMITSSSFFKWYIVFTQT